MKRILKLRGPKLTFAQQVQTQWEQQMRAVGSLSESCQQVAAQQLAACLPLLLSLNPVRVSGWQDKPNHSAHLLIQFRNDSQLTLAEHCPSKEEGPDATDTRISVYRGGELQSYIACHHSKLYAALQRSLPALARPKPALS